MDNHRKKLPPSAEFPLIMSCFVAYSWIAGAIWNRWVVDAPQWMHIPAWLTVLLGGIFACALGTELARKLND